MRKTMKISYKKILADSCITRGTKTSMTKVGQGLKNEELIKLRIHGHLCTGNMAFSENICVKIEFQFSKG